MATASASCSPGGKVYSFDPDGLELAWNTKVICHTSRGQELGRVVQPNHELGVGAAAAAQARRPAGDGARREDAGKNRVEAKRDEGPPRALRGPDCELKPVSAELVFDGSRLVFSYQAEEPAGPDRAQEKLRRRLERRVELRSVGPRECAGLCGDHGLCGDQHCCRKFPPTSSRSRLRMAKDQELPMSSGRITGLCGRSAAASPSSTRRTRASATVRRAVGRRVETPHGRRRRHRYQVLDGHRAPVEPRAESSFDIRSTTAARSA
jgi:hypothetical protein